MFSRSSVRWKSVFAQAGLWIGVVGLLVGGVVTQAQAAKVRVVVLSRTLKSMPSEYSRRVNRFFHHSMSKQKRLEVPTLKQAYKSLLSRATPPGIMKKLKLIAKLIQDAKQLYSNTIFPLDKRCKYALQKLDQAIDLIDPTKSYMDKPDLIRDLYLYQALAHMGVKDGNSARKYVIMLSKFAPSWSSAGKGLPVTFVKYHSQIQRWLNSKPQYSMKLDSKPSGAKLYHNYRYVGRTPQTLTGLLPGKHEIRIVLPRYQVWERTANLNPKKMKSRRSITANVPLKSDPNALTVKGIPLFERDAGLSDEILDRLEAIVQKLNAKFLYVTEPAKSSKGQRILKIAIYKRGSRKIFFGALRLGSGSNAFVSPVERYTRRAARRLR